MRAIIIDDKDAKALLDSLKLEKLEEGNHFCGDKPVTLQHMHRTFHFVVCRWLQEQGADVVR